MRIHLVRHGQIPSNVTGALDTLVPGPSLTDVGREQAQSLVTHFDGLEFASIWTSTAIRTQETAFPLARHRGLELNILDDLREIEAGDMEMSVHPEDRQTYHEVITRWILGELDVPLANGTTGREVLDRFERGLAQIQETGHDEVVLVAHGAIISFWVGARCSNMTEQLFAEYPVVNTGVATVEATESGWKALSWMGASV